MKSEIKTLPIPQLNPNQIISQFMELWINPEIKSRKENGQLPNDFIMSRGQVIFSLGLPPIIRLNNEVKIKIKVKVSRTIKKGEIVMEKDVLDVAEITNIEEEKDFAFVIIVKIGEKVYVAFNFESDISKAKKLYEIGNSFLISAQREFKLNNSRQFIELLLIAAENLVKSRLYLLPDNKIRKVKTHGGTQMIMNAYAKRTKIISQDQKLVFNKLIKYRDPARYDINFALTNAEVKYLLPPIEELDLKIKKLFMAK